MNAHPPALPLAALMAWTVVMFLWMYATRLPAMSRAGIDVRNLRGSTGRSLDDALPAEVQWKAHNYNHLLEQPVLFYAAGLLLILLRAESDFALMLAWFYVVARVVHSLVQAVSNLVPLRFAIFMLGSLALIGLIILAVRAALAAS
jgi:hypothetical protein